MESLASILLIIILAISIIVNIITEVVKSMVKFKSAEALNIFVTILSVALTALSLIAFFQYKGYMLTWYIVASFIIIGIFVGYAAMFGYDKFLSKVKPLIKE